MPPQWKTTLRPLCAEVATTAAESRRPDATCSAIRSNAITRSSVPASGDASSSAGTCSDSSPVKFSVPRTIRSMSRFDGEASTSPQRIPSQIAAPVSSATSTPSGSVAAM